MVKFLTVKPYNCIELGRAKMIYNDLNKSERRKEMLSAFDKLLTIMDELREKCPWDKKQTIESLRYLTIEETFELSDAIVEKY